MAITGDGGNQTLTVDAISLNAVVVDTVKRGIVTVLRIELGAIRIMADEVIFSTGALLHTAANDWWINEDAYNLKAASSYADPNAITFWTALGGDRLGHLWADSTATLLTLGVETGEAYGIKLDSTE